MRKEGKHWDAAWLRAAYVDDVRTAVDIARECGVDPCTIINRLVAFGVPTRTRWPQHPYWNKDWLQQEYIEEQRSPIDIANQFGVDAEAIYYWIKKHQLPVRTMSESAYIRHARLREERNRSGKERP